jgi:hypothetical protein
VVVIFMGSEQSEQRVFVFHRGSGGMEEMLFASEVVPAKNVPN